MQVRDATVGPLSGDPRRVGLRDLDALVRDAERVRDDLRVHRARPLADLRARREHAHAGSVSSSARPRLETQLAAAR